MSPILRKVFGELISKRWFLLIALALLGILLLAEFKPLEDDATFQQMTLSKIVSSNEEYIWADFGSEKDYRIPRTEATEALLVPEAVGSRYWVKAVQTSAVANHNVYALKDATQVLLDPEDGLTRIRQTLPTRTLVIIMSAGLLVFYHLIIRTSTCKENA